ncbi:hypothetical protein ACP0HM_00315 [Escherichia coli]
MDTRVAFMTQYSLSFVVLQRVLHFYSFCPNGISRRNKPLKRRAWMRVHGFLMDYASGKVLAEGNADEKLDPAEPD